MQRLNKLKFTEENRPWKEKFYYLEILNCMKYPRR